GEEQREERLCDAAALRSLTLPRAADDDPRNDVDLRLRDGFGEALHHLLGDLELRAAVRTDLLFDRDRLRDADASRLVGLRFTERADTRGFGLREEMHLGRLGLRHRLLLRRLLDAPLVRRAALVGLDGDRELALGEGLLRRGAGHGLAELALLGRGLLLTGEGLHLLLRDLTSAELLEDDGDVLVARARGRGADEDLLELEVVVGEAGLHLFTRDRLDDRALLNELDERARLADVLEVRGDHRIQRLLDEALHVTEALHDERRLAVVDVHHDGER